LAEAGFQNVKDDKKEEEKELPQSVFPYHKDLLFGMDHNDKIPFKHKDKSIEFIGDNLNCHGFGFLLHKDLDEIQLDLLMIASWSILQHFMEKQINSQTKTLLRFCLIIRILRLCLFLCYQVKMEGRVMSQHSLRQHANCNYYIA
jgi:hypothetical protein